MCPNSIFCSMREEDTTKPVVSPGSGHDALNPQIQGHSASESLGSTQTGRQERQESNSYLDTSSFPQPSHHRAFPALGAIPYLTLMKGL